jgi:hypothetical protein
MTFGSGRVTAALLLGAALAGLPCCSFSQQAQASLSLTAADNPPEAQIPDAPVPQIELAANTDPQAEQVQGGQQPSPNSDPFPAADSAPPGSDPGGASKNGASQSGSSSSNSVQQPGAEETQQQKAAEQIKEQEKQRIAGILPSFNVSYRSDAASMTASQKIGLAFRSSIDPYTFGAAFIVAGFGELEDHDTGFGWGAEGYFKRSGAAYLDAFDGAMIGNGLLPALLHQDPRFFRLGHGSVRRRVLYAVASSFICKHDNTGRWEPNYSNVGGNIIAGAISNLYYPSEDSGWGETITNGLVVTTEGTLASVFQEFWPDISRKFLHKDPTHGLDAQARAADAAKKIEKQKKQEIRNPN